MVLTHGEGMDCHWRWLLPQKRSFFCFGAASRPRKADFVPVDCNRLRNNYSLLYQWQNHWSKNLENLKNSFVWSFTKQSGRKINYWAMRKSITILHLGWLHLPYSLDSWLIHMQKINCININPSNWYINFTRPPYLVF